MSVLCRFYKCVTHPHQQAVPPSVTEPPFAMPTSTRVSVVCPKCGTTKQFGKRSCCARGGTWFKNCGDAGDTKFDHTWAEGVEACQSGLWKH